ncbi:Gfo/Idh/MocA family protein [Gracilibacillus alcaliphilus]|uniref:Gfo/Idh/MocA family protein n=1 Tax=Gracilibacillus alcaliphilus TaxID=1401441 RepID=UPI00195A4C83|nr:Gfo/Idh/MocA family oxidoreductase [Gracilibacillus alcaliphilus]MBM7676418.1 putative dehydrogenase [Gracilibacillus alcaliphilus]
MNKKDGMNYAPTGRSKKVVENGEFQIAAIGLDHGHIYGMCNGLIEAGAKLMYVYDSDPEKVNAFCERYPDVVPVDSEEEIYNKDSIDLIACASIPIDRFEVGKKALSSGKHFFSDKPGFIKLEHVQQARELVSRTGLKWGIYYSERLHVESAMYAGELVKQGAIGRVVQVIGTGPHRLNASARPDWFFKPDYFGGILCDIGSHQIEQFLHYTGATDAQVLHSKVANYNNKQYSDFQDFGDATLLADNGATFYFRVDWFTPDGLQTWGDGRAFILGTEGYIEIRKYIDIANNSTSDHLYLVNNEKEEHFGLKGQVGFAFFGEFILDCLHNTEKSMTQEHIFRVAELSIETQEKAVKVE